MKVYATDSVHHVDDCAPSHSPTAAIDGVGDQPSSAVQDSLQEQSTSASSHKGALRDMAKGWVFHVNTSTGEPYLQYLAHNITRIYRGYDAECNPVEKEMPVLAPYTIKVSDFKRTTRTDRGYHVPADDKEAWVVQCEVFDSENTKLCTNHLSWQPL